MNHQQIEPIHPANIFFTVAQFSKRHSAFSNPSLRWLIYNEEINGLAKTGAIIRVGRKILIEEKPFLEWLKDQRGVVA